MDLGGLADACDPACNARARALVRARQLARAQVPAADIEAVLAMELELTEPEAADVVTELAPVLLIEARCGRGQLAEYLWLLANGTEGITKHATSVSLAAATLLAKHHLGLDGVSPDEKVRKLLAQAEADAAKHLGGRQRMRVVGGRAA